MGTQKRREGENTNTNTLGPERANPEKARTDKDQRRGGKTDAPEPTYHSET